MHLYKIFFRLEARYKLEAKNIGRCTMLSCAKVILAIAGVMHFLERGSSKKTANDCQCMYGCNRKKKMKKPQPGQIVEVIRFKNQQTSSLTIQ